jgi:hypothetical protein
VSTGWKMLEDAIDVFTTKLVIDETGPVASVIDVGVAMEIDKIGPPVGKPAVWRVVSTEPNVPGS